MGVIFCKRDINDEKLVDDKEDETAQLNQILDIIQRYKPDRSLHFNANKFEVRITKDAENRSTKDSISNFDEKNRKYQRNTIKSSVRPSYVLDFEKRQRKILV